MDMFATFGHQAAFPKKVNHIVRVDHHPHASIMGECSCGRRSQYMSPSAVRTQDSGHAAAIVDDAPGRWLSRLRCSSVPTEIDRPTLP